ncbi:ATP-binding cassette domain-containing protein [Actinomadura sp. LD22]|uniref:ATP-binding cassette domain-containing protein n=1 Tax=Actinomadura physcomitrii TaxID=2650748 RepID=A0A6I4MLL6_9ACTN|nr:ATP-binding cassette domain-containing protein [Actinomadura physcomitrii]
MGHVEVGHVSHALPDGRVLLDDVSFRVGDGVTAALVGPNGAGKSHFLRLLAAVAEVLPRGAAPVRPVAHTGVGVARRCPAGPFRLPPVRSSLVSGLLWICPRTRGDG